jgi:hypothetical protein
MWVLNPRVATNKDKIDFYTNGVLIFGGLNDKREASNILYCLKPAYEKNKKYISHKSNGTYKRQNKTKVYYEL